MDSNEVALWHSIKTSALLGTERQPFQPPTLAGKLGQILNLEQTQKSAAALLLSAATLSLYQLAGQQSQKITTEEIAPCEFEDLPRCSFHAASFLERILQARSPSGEKYVFDRLVEWLAIAQQKGQRVPEHCLSELLDLGKLPCWRDKVLAVIGKRGRWLAVQNSEWSYVTENFDDFDWTISPHPSRLSHLETMRQKEPNRARELLQSTWKEESVEARLEFLETLEIGLSSTDEPFLEEVLNDRSKTVRREAARLLVRLPDSQYCDRMFQRLAALIKFNSQTLEVTLPTACDAAMKRDGVEPKPNHPPIGERSWWLQELIVMTPLEFWRSHLGVVNSSDLIEIGLVNEWKEILLNGLQWATIWQKNTTWASAILEQPHYPDCPGVIYINELIKVLSPNQREKLCFHLLETRSINLKDPYVVSAFRELLWSGDSWSNELTNAMLQSISAHPLNSQSFDSQWDLEQFYKGVALCVAPDLIAHAIQRFSDLAQSIIPTNASKRVIQHLQDAIALLKFRQDMIQSFEN